MALEGRGALPWNEGGPLTLVVEIRFWALVQHSSRSHAH